VVRKNKTSFFLLLFGSVVVCWMPFFVGGVVIATQTIEKRERGPKKKIDEEDEGYLSIWLYCLF